MTEIRVVNADHRIGKTLTLIPGVLECSRTRLKMLVPIVVFKGSAHCRC